MIFFGRIYPKCCHANSWNQTLAKPVKHRELLPLAKIKNFVLVLPFILCSLDSLKFDYFGNQVQGDEGLHIPVARSEEL